MCIASGSTGGCTHPRHRALPTQTKDEIEESRDKRTPSPWRDRPVAESLKLFEDMRRGERCSQNTVLILVDIRGFVPIRHVVGSDWGRQQLEHLRT